MTTYDVLVVGAGPTGLMLASWLARAGVKALVIDDKPGPVNESRALGVQARTMETYDMMGLGARALREGVPARGAAVWVGHRRVVSAVLGEMGRGVSPHPYLFVMGQDRTERLLLDDLQAHGGDVAYGTRLVSLAQDAERVTAEIELPDGQTVTVQARWACGCDGAKSPVRHALGLGFAGGTYPHRFFVADVTADGPLGEGELGLCATETGFLAFFPMLGHRHYRIIGIVPAAYADDPDVGIEAVRAGIERDSAMTLRQTHWFSTYNVHHRVAERFRRGRAFLLGDAGHIHSPVGGQGMNTGLMDAANLGWKLGAVIDGAADERLLDSYEPERMPFARRLVATTDEIFTFVTTTSSWLSRLRTTLIPIGFGLGTHLPVLRRELYGLISQTRVAYHDSPLSCGQAGHVKGGDRLPWVHRRDGSSNYDVLTRLQPHLQVYGSVPGPVEAYAAAHPGLPLVNFPADQPALDAGFEPGAVYLVRPDGYVAYAATHFAPTAFEQYVRTTWGVWPDALGRA